MSPDTSRGENGGRKDALGGTFVHLLSQSKGQLKEQSDSVSQSSPHEDQWCTRAGPWCLGQQGQPVARGLPGEVLTEATQRSGPAPVRDSVGREPEGPGDTVSVSGSLVGSVWGCCVWILGHLTKIL